MNVIIRLVSLGLILWASAAWALTLPWTTFSSMTRDVAGAQLMTCPVAKEVYMVRIVRGEDAFAYFFAPSTGRIMFLFWKGNVEGAQPDEIGVGIVDPDQHDVIPPLKWRPGRQVIAEYGSPCEILFPRDA